MNRLLIGVYMEQRQENVRSCRIYQGDKGILLKILKLMLFRERIKGYN